MSQINAYAVHSVNKKTVKNSSSGGVFFSIASYYISHLKGIVYGATIENGIVFHKRVDNIKDLLPLMRSKYVMSEIRNTFRECALDLKNGLSVFYVSTPCLITGLISYLKTHNIDTSNLLTGDVFCHGAPLKKYWFAYLAEKYTNQKIKNVNFRRKKPSWENYSIKVNKKTISIHKDEYFRLFLKNYTFGDPCYNCKFKGENRLSDFSIGDFWGVNSFYPERFHKNGISLLIIRKQKELLINILKKTCKLDKVDYGLSIYSNPAYYSSVNKPIDINSFIEDFSDKGFLYSANKYSSPDVSKRFSIKLMIKKIFFAFGLSKSKKNRKKTRIIADTIGIITDDGYTNFGNRLQNYALSLVLKNNGFKPVNLWYDNRERFSLFKYISFILVLNKTLSSLPDANREKKIRKACLLSGEKRITFSYSPLGKQKLLSVNKIILGSDQIWNWTYNRSRITFNLGLLGTDFTGKIISYAASFGTNYVPSELEFIYKYGLSKTAAIGVREIEGEKIVENLGFHATLNLDPTLLLNYEDWNNAINLYSKVKISKKYLLFYSLHGRESEILIAKSLAREKNMLFINVYDKKSPYYCINHFDFINLIKNASLVFTNSYHAFIFSYIFGTKIYLFERPGMNTRFNTLFQLLKYQPIYNEIIDLSSLRNTIPTNLINESISFIVNNLSKSSKTE